ncbi:MAG: MFS transporter [Candidatus Binatia bacterium]|nr:MFS transporter [Candidatus Binatia bacterium]
MATENLQLKSEGIRKAVGGVRGNIWKMYAIAAVNDAMFLIPVIVPFFRENGLTIGDVFWLQGIFALAIVVLEIPSGYLSDRWGRKKTMLVGSVMGVTGMLWYGLSFSFWGFVVGEIMLAVGNSCFSGTQEAMIGDTLLELNEGDDYRRVAGQQRFYGFSAEAVASVAGGLIALVSLRATVWATIIPFAISLVLVTLLQEPKRHKLQETRHFRAMWDITTHTLVRNIPLRSVVVINAVISCLTLTLVWFTQPYQTLVGLPLVLFGVTHAVIMICAGLASKWTHKFQGRVDDRIILMLIAGVVVGSYVALGAVTSLWGLAWLFTGRVMWGFLTPITSDMVNRMTVSSVRATVHSASSFARSLLFAAVSPMVGYIADVLTLNQALMLTGVVSGVVVTIVFLLTAPVWRLMPK